MNRDTTLKNRRIADDVRNYRAALTGNGWVAVPDDQSIRAAVVKDMPGEYVSYFDPELRKILIIKHWLIREWLSK